MNKINGIEGRIALLRRTMAEKSWDGVLFTSYENRRYFSGFTGSAGYLLVSAEAVLLLTDRRYTEQAEKETTNCQVVEHGGPGRQKRVAGLVAAAGVTRLCMETTIAAGEYFDIVGHLPGVSVTLENDCFLTQRMVKDEEEIRHIRAAIGKADRALERLIPKLYIGMTEKELACELHYLAEQEGAEAMSFGTIVGSGPRGAMAHGVPTDRVIGDGEMVVLDYGVKANGYLSDTTRTLLFGRVPKEQMVIFNLVNKAMDEAFAAIAPGVLAKEVEQAHRDVFLEAGVEAFALRGLGHGVGLEIHEWPSVVIGSETRLAPGMVFTVEPGLYFSDRFGVRTEDMVLVTESGMENLTSAPVEIHISRKVGEQ